MLCFDRSSFSVQIWSYAALLAWKSTRQAIVLWTRGKIWQNPPVGVQQGKSCELYTKAENMTHLFLLLAKAQSQRKETYLLFSQEYLDVACGSFITGNSEEDSGSCTNFKHNVFVSLAKYPRISSVMRNNRLKTNSGIQLTSHGGHSARIGQDSQEEKPLLTESDETETGRRFSTNSQGNELSPNKDVESPRHVGGACSWEHVPPPCEPKNSTTQCATVEHTGVSLCKPLVCANWSECAIWLNPV